MEAFKPSLGLGSAVLHPRDDLVLVEGRRGLGEVDRARDGRVVGSGLQFEVPEVEDGLPHGGNLAGQDCEI